MALTVMLLKLNIPTAILENVTVPVVVVNPDVGVHAPTPPQPFVRSQGSGVGIASGIASLPPPPNALDPSGVAPRIIVASVYPTSHAITEQPFNTFVASALLDP